MNRSCTHCGALLTPEAQFCSSCGTPAGLQADLLRNPDESLLRGQILEGRYKIMRLLGQGGFSRVYGAVDLRLRTPCAIKENSEFDRSAYEQFITEAQLLARLRHSNMTKVTDYFSTPGGEQFLVMEYVPGTDLEQLMNNATSLLPWHQVVEWGLIVCDVLQYLHTQEPPIIHRDIKPANLRVTPDGTLMVIDLGIAKVQKEGTVTRRAAQAYSGGYSPVEQFLGQGTDARSDLYALAATLYHLLTGTMPPEAIARMRGAPLTPLDQVRSDVPPLLARALERTMAIEPGDRPPSAQALALVFQRVLEENPTYDPAGNLIGVQTRTPSRPRVISQPTGEAAHRISAQPAIAVAVESQPRPLSQSQPQIEARPGNIVWPGDGREMVPVAAGPFAMGCDQYDADEMPQHSVDLPAYLIDRFPVTCRDYARFVAATGHAAPRYWGDNKPPAAVEDHPVVEVTLDDARAYAHWAGKRLPSEAEWEKAACWNPQTQQVQVYPWGDEWVANNANGRDGGAGGTVQIGAYSPAGDSPLGVAELCGNVWEWTASAYKKYPYDPHNGREALTTSGLRVTRGGSWTCSPDFVRAANRNVCAGSDADFELGFRCAATPE